MSEKESLLKFPCDFTIKVFGQATDEFETEVLGIIIKHVGKMNENAISNRLSKDAKYLAMSISIHVESREQLDALYQDLSSCPKVLMAL